MILHNTLLLNFNMRSRIWPLHFKVMNTVTFKTHIWIQYETYFSLIKDLLHLDHKLTLKYENEKYIIIFLNLNFAQYLFLTKSGDLFSYISEIYIKFPLIWYITWRK